MNTEWEGLCIRDDDAKTDDGLARTAGAAAATGAVVGSLGGESGEPDDGEEDVNHEHGSGIGEVAGSFPSGGHEEEYPGGDGEEALQTRDEGLEGAFSGL